MLIIFAVIAFVVASYFDAKSSMNPGVYEFWPLYRWPPWKRGPFQLWMYIAATVLVIAIAVWQDRYIELFILAGARLFFALYWNPRQMRKAAGK